MISAVLHIRTSTRDNQQYFWGLVWIPNDSCLDVVDKFSIDSCSDYIEKYNCEGDIQRKKRKNA